jgi:hypothetical protein
MSDSPAISGAPIRWLFADGFLYSVRRDGNIPAALMRDCKSDLLGFLLGSHVVHALLLRVAFNLFSLRSNNMSPEPIRANDDVLRRVQGEFLEMPGLRLTPAQARRLWGLDAAACDALLSALVDAQFLFRTRDGAFMRVEHATPIKATRRTRNTIAAA